MQRTRPLAESYPELSVLDQPGFREYRVENWHLARDGSQNIIKGATGFTWKLAVIPLIIGLIWNKIGQNPWAIAATTSCVAYVIWTKCTQVLYESVIVIAPHGIQLETHRGWPPSFVLSASKRFIPTSALREFVINEGLRGWNVRYYLVAIQQNKPDNLTLQVAYENILPHFPVLLEVFQGVQDTLFSRPAKGH